ncbi:Wsp signal transduction system regulator diguanylate cyclase WspR [soil metagenome]
MSNAFDADDTGIGIPSDQTAIVVLLVDDQTMIGEAVRRALAAETDIQFEYCARGEDAIDHALRVGPTVILQDLVMPGVDGLDLVRAYRQHPGTRDIPVIVLSSKEDAAVKSECFAADVSDYLVKLPDRIELIARIRHQHKAYLNLRQRDAAYRALSESQHKLLDMNRALQRLSHVDGLTGISNRRYLDEYLDLEWRRSARELGEFSLLMVDVDNFKQYNDSFGHLAGDEVLKRIAQTLRDCLHRPADLAARFGGEEFVVVLPGTEARGARVVGERIRRRIEALGVPHGAAGAGPLVTVSIGGAGVVPARGMEASELLASADAALYEAKNNGKNQVIVREVVDPADNADHA